jgi:Tfp pilus assembly protein PilO
MRRDIPVAAVAAVALAIVAVFAFVLAIKPVRDERVRLERQIAAAKRELASDSVAKPAKPRTTGDPAEVFRLAKAMPERHDVSEIILELNSIATAAGIQFLAIQPQDEVSTGSYGRLPITLTFEGRYYDLTDFLFRLRNLVAVRDGELTATGRLYTLDGLDLHQGGRRFPTVEAVLTVSAFAFGAGSPAGEAPAEAGTPTGTTGDDVNPEDTGTTPENTAAGAGREQAITSGGS